MKPPDARGRPFRAWADDDVLVLSLGRPVNHDHDVGLVDLKIDERGIHGDQDGTLLVGEGAHAQILVLALVLGLSCIVVLSLIKASPILIATIVALLAESVVTALFYLFYRVSFHLTGLVIIIIMAAQTWGPLYLLLLLTVPPVFWAKYHLRDHTIPQLFAGIAVATVVSLLTLLMFGRLNAL